MADRWLEADEWWRAGQGRSWDLPCSCEELIAAARAIGARDADTLDVILCDRTRVDGARRSTSRHRLVPLDGLILVQPARRAVPARMAVVARVEHRTTGERVEHATYDRLFHAIKRRLYRGHLSCWASPTMIPSGPRMKQSR